jgi:hypothetical protein
MVENTTGIDEMKMVEPVSGDPAHEQPLSGNNAGEIVPPTSRSATLRVACFFIISAGVLSIANGISAASTTGWISILGGGEEVRYCGVLIFIFGMGAIVSGVAALALRRITPAFAGAVMGIAGGGLAGFWLGILALALLAMSDEDL